MFFYHENKTIGFQPFVQCAFMHLHRVTQTTMT